MDRWEYGLSEEHMKIRKMKEGQGSGIGPKAQESGSPYDAFHF